MWVYACVCVWMAGVCRVCVCVCVCVCLSVDVCVECVPMQVLVSSHSLFHMLLLCAGAADKDGRPVIVFSACRLPPSYQISHQRLFE